jgi:hypothetical protein
MRNYLNLDIVIHNAKFGGGVSALTEQQKSDILRIVGKGCRKTTKEKLSRRLELPLSLWKSYGIYSRITLDDKGADYICGQSWTDEMRTLKECILGL